MGHVWANAPKIDSEFNKAEYDEIADTYENFIAEWGYEGPQVAANLLKRVLPLDRTVVDCGCGTGLTGKALSQIGYQSLIGMDISPNLDVAAL